MKFFRPLELILVFFVISIPPKFYCQEKSGKPDGMNIEYYENGNLKSKIYYKNGKPFGITQLFNKEGNLAEVGYWDSENTRWIGNYYSFHPNGQKLQDFNFGLNGKRTGIQKYYFSNGIIKSIGIYLDGKLHGVFYEFDSLGNFQSKKKEIYDSINSKSNYFATDERFPADSMLIDYVKNENQNIFRISKLQAATSEAQFNLEKLKSEKQKNFIYLIFSLVFGISLVAIIYGYIQLNRKKSKIEIQNKTIEEKQKEIIDSIKYARRIQNALITSENYIKKNLNRLSKK